MIEEPMTCQNCYYRDYDPGYPPCEDCLKDKWEIGKLSKWCGAIWEDKSFSNADRIRAMSDEELAEWIFDRVKCRNCFILPCVNHGEDGKGTCRDLWLNWLKGNVEGGKE